MGKFPRRSISITVLFVSWVLALLLAIVALLSVLLVDAWTKDWRLPRTRALLFFFYFLNCEILGVLAAGLIWLVTIGGYAVGVSRYLAINYWLQRIWSGAVFYGAVRIYGIRLALDIPVGSVTTPQILLVRHTSTADTVLAAALLANSLGIQYRYVLKSELLWDPCLDIVGNRLPNAFIDRSSRDMSSQVKLIASLGDNLGERSGVLIYPEGTRFTPSKYKAAMEKVRQHSTDQIIEIASGLRNVLPPRPAGTLALLKKASQGQLAILGHTGFEGARSFWEFWRGGLVNQTLHAKLWIYDLASIPKEEETREKWLFERWSELDNWISGKKSNAGCVPGE